MEHTKPIITVIMPAYNASLFICSAVKSVINQTYNRFELIIVNDGSTDGTGAVVKQFSDKRIKYFKQKNKGVSSARNLAIKNSKGKWLAFLDADDVWLPNTLQTFVDSFDNTDFIFGEYTYLGGVNNGKIAKDLSKIPDSREYLVNELIDHNYIGIGAVCMRINLTKEYFDETIVFAEDYKLWLSLFSKDIRIKKLNKVLYNYRIHPESALHKNNQQDYSKAKLLLGFAKENKNAKKRASQYYNDYVNEAISESLKDDDYHPNFDDYKSFYLRPKTKLKLLLYMKHPKVLNIISIIIRRGLS